MTGFTELLARLLSDASLRAEFVAQPVEVAERLTADESVRAMLLQLDRDQLAAQADGLIDKRRHEVVELLPVTFSRLGLERGRQLFAEFAGGFWPTGHDRHQQDAVAFGEFLLICASMQISRPELNWLRFVSGVSRLSIHFSTDLQIRGLRHAGFQICYRRGGQCGSIVTGLPIWWGR